MNAPEKILQSHRLRRTQSRVEILDILSQHGIAMSEPELETAMGGRCDRVTIYRTLTTFLDKGILHKVLDDAGAMRYALCPDECTGSHSHQHDHVHFKCRQCGKTTCVEDVRIPEVSLPHGFLLEEVNMLLQGVCADCNH